MRKSRKTIAILAIIAMVLMMIPVQAFAADSTFVRLSGDTRVDTAIAVANSGWANGATNVVVVPSNDQNLVDALAVAPLAEQINAPILLTDNASLDAKVSAEIATLKAANVYAVGALSDAVISQLKALSGVTVTQIKGADRFATAAQIAAMVKTPAGSIVVGSNGLADALSAASFAAANGYVILIAGADGTVPASESAYLGSKVIILGGPALVADIAGATRTYGNDRYETNSKFIDAYKASFKFDKVYVANGDTMVDALPGSVLAAQTNSPIVLTNSQNAPDMSKNLSANSQVIGFGGSGVVSNSTLTAVQTGSGAVAPSGPVAVQSVKATAANAIQVTFTSAPVDTSKVTFAVDLSGTAVTVTPTWSDDKTQATLAGSANFAPGTYNIGVKNDTTDLGSNTVTFTQQAISKINITSKVFAVSTLQSNHQGAITNGTGFITYTVQDQYGNDISNSSMANGLTWTPGISYTTEYAKNGVLYLTPSSTPFTQFTSMSISCFDSTTGVSASATLPVSNTGTLSGITLNKLTSPNNDDLNAGNGTGQWYIDYTALDASGNPTTDFNMVNEGILNRNNDGTINGGGFLKIQVVQDPNDNSKAAFSVTIDQTNINSVVTDMQIPITVVTTSGQSSTLNVTLKKSSTKVDSIILNAPAQMVASGDTINIPFTATDPTGKVMTLYQDIVNSGNIKINAGTGTVTNASTNGGFVRNADGTASIEYTAPPNTTSNPITDYLTATVSTTGKFSQLTLSIQKPAKADTLDADTNIQFLQKGAVMAVDFGYNWGGLSLKDQYGRVMDMNNESKISGGKEADTDSSSGYYYYVVATTTAGTSLTVDPFNTHNNYSYDGHWITLQASSSTEGSTTIDYEVYKAKIGSAPAPSSDKKASIGKSVTYTVVKDTDITGYSLDAVSNPLYMLSDQEITDAANDYDGSSRNGFTYSLTKFGKTGSYGFESGTNRPQEYAANPSVWGKTAGGGLVLLAASTIQAVSIDSSKFYLLDPTLALTTPATRTASTTILKPGVNNFVVLAHDITEGPSGTQLATTDTSASTNLTVTLVDSSGNYVNVTQPIKSTTDGKTVSKVTFPGIFNGDDGDRGMKKRGDSTVVINPNMVDGGGVITFDRLQGKRVTRWDSTGNSPSGTRAVINLRAADQFGTLGGIVSLVSANTAGQSFGGGFTASVDPTTMLLTISKTDPTTHVVTMATHSDIQEGDYFTLTGSGPNGVMGTVKIVFQW